MICAKHLRDACPVFACMLASAEALERADAEEAKTPAQATAPVSDFTQLRHYAEARKHPGWSAFLGSMVNRAYGHEALNDAWAWFSTGWDKAIHEHKYGARK